MTNQANQCTLIWDTRTRDGAAAGRARVVVACCSLAANLRVRVGMPIAQAVSLCENQYETVHVESHDRVADLTALQKLTARLQKTITPMAAVETMDAKAWAGHPRHQPESIFAEITGTTHLYGGESGLLDVTEDVLRRYGLEAHLAIADNVALAWAMAHQGGGRNTVIQGRMSRDPNASEASEGAGKVQITTNKDGECLHPHEAAPPGASTAAPHPAHGSPMRSPSTIRVIVPSRSVRPDQPGIVDVMPINSLRIESETARQLNRLGIYRIGELLDLPREGLASRLGTTLIQRIDEILGTSSKPVDVYHAPPTHHIMHELQYPTADAEILADRLSNMVEQLIGQMTGGDAGILCIRCQMLLVDAPEVSFEVGLFAPTLDEEHLSGLIVSRMDSLVLADMVQRMHLSVTLTGPRRSQQVSLFDDPVDGGLLEQASGSAVGRLVDVLSNRLGRSRVVDVLPSPDPLPEKSFEQRPLAGRPRVIARRTRQSSSRPKRKDDHCGDFLDSTTFESQSSLSDVQNVRRWSLPSRHDAMRRPLSLLPSAITIQASMDGGFCKYLSTDRLPKRFRVGGVVHRVLRSWGPERIETNWWNGDMVRRDYWRIETNQNQWWWIYRVDVPGQDSSASRSQWWLHGRFS
ncbi:MAG: DNA polymerase Y family protein [Planctomycetota bacterium]